MKQSQRTLALWIVIILLSVTAVHLFNSRPALRKPIQFSEFLQELKTQKVEKVTVQDGRIIGKYRPDFNNGDSFETVGPTGSESLYKTLEESGVEVQYKRNDEGSFWQQLIFSWLPTLLLFLFFFFFMRQMQMGGGRAMSFGKSRARLTSDKQKKVTFKDVAGVDEVKQELEEIIQFLKEPKKFTSLGGHIPKGVLLVGPPGTGKTLLARAISGEAGVPFFSISGSDFVEMFVGVGASRVRDLFEQGKRNAPCIIFIDEIDAVGRHRGAGMGGGHDEREQTLNQLLVEMDGFESNEGVILIAATNRPDVLDAALLRPGRFDRRVVVPRPDLNGRAEILRVHTKEVPLDPSVDVSIVARGTPGFCGADLANLVNEAALHAARFDKKKVDMRDFEDAKDKVLMGAERRSLILSEQEKRQISYHESGHTLVAKLIPGTDPVHKVTIIPRGMALGTTQQLPEGDSHIQTKDYTENTIAVLMGGRCAEELIFGTKTTGAGNDIERATELARRMVCEWGMSEKLGPLAYGKREEDLFLGRDFGQSKNYSEQTSISIDDEIKYIITYNYERAKKLLTDNIETLHRMAKYLLDYESLEGDQLDKIIRGEDLPPAPRPAAATPEPKKEGVVIAPPEPSGGLVPSLRPGYT